MQVFGTKCDVLGDRLGEELPLGVLHHIAHVTMERTAPLPVVGVGAVHDDAADVGQLQGTEQAQQR